jgi:hypothetical protein
LIAKWRFLWCPQGVRVGVVVTLSEDGKRVIWPKGLAPSEHAGGVE